MTFFLSTIHGPIVIVTYCVCHSKQYIVKENSGRLSVGLVGKVNGSVLEEVMSRLRIRSDWLTHKGRYRAARAATRN